MLRLDAVTDRGSHPPARERVISDKITVENVNTPRRTTNVNAAKYGVMKTAFLKVLPDCSPGLNQQMSNRRFFRGAKAATARATASKRVFLPCGQANTLLLPALTHSSAGARTLCSASLPIAATWPDSAARPSGSKEIHAKVKAHLPDDPFPGGQTSGWWAKTVQLDLEAKGMVVREQVKPLRWHQVAG